ncbi:MAG: hypothetical protein JW715_07585 [Sedimentisphaerales bacterium]|nr:hypothetical protein [Sedimentisphaerales bacterium]
MPPSLQIVLSFGWEILPLWYFVAMETARNFGKSRLFGIGLFLLAPVFYGILAFGRAVYGQAHKGRFEYPGRILMTIFNRELQSYFTTPLAYVFLIVFLVASAHYTFVVRHFFEIRQADMTAFFMNLPLLFILIVPATSMRLWAEERKVGSIELLFTLPVKVTQAVLGKFFAAWLFLAIALTLTFPMIITVCYLGEPDVGPIVTGYLGSFLMAGGYLAIGCFFSAISKNQVIAFVLSVVACAILGYSDAPSSQKILNDFFGSILVGGIRFVSQFAQFSVRGHFESMLRGVLEFRDITYFLLLIVGWIAACTFILYNRKTS